MNFHLAGTGAYRPRSARERDGGRAPDRPGVAAADETTSFMAAAAAREALAAAGWHARDLDVLIGACAVMEQPIPGTALLVQRRLGIGGSGIPAFDVNATCLSALQSLDLAAMGLAAGRWRRVLIVSADLPNAALDPADRHAVGTFGDGAAALALGAEGPHRLLATRFESFGDHGELCTIEAGGTRLRPHADLERFLAASRFRMNGPALFRATARLFPGFLDRLLGEAGVARDAIDLVVPHQASAPALAHLARVLGGPRERIVDIFAAHGNQGAASLPNALHVAQSEGRLRPGMTVLLVGTAAGITLGGSVIAW